MRSVFSGLVLLILLVGTLAVASKIQPTSAAGTPVISSVSPITATNLQTINIEGSGFGNTWPQTVSVGDGSVDTVQSSVTPYMDICDSGKTQKTNDTSDGGENWAAGASGSNSSSVVGIYLVSWSDNEIILGGFGTHLGTNGQGSWYIEPGDPLTVDVFTSNGQATYYLTVGAAQGRPIASVLVSAVGASGRAGYAITDSSGRYNMTTGLLTGTYNLTTYATGYIESEATSVNVTAGQTTPNVSFGLQVSGVISGRVTDALNQTPINGTDIYAQLSNGTGTFGCFGVTGSDGSYLLDTNLPTGMYNVSVIVSPNGYISSKTTASVIAGVETNNVNIALARSGIISGKVAAPNGTGLPGIQVSAMGSSTSYYGYAITDSAGNYRIVAGLGTDNYTIDGYGDGNYTLRTGTVAVIAGQETSGINMILTPVTTPTSGTITGRITDQNNSPIVNAVVSATENNGSGSGSTTSDSNGNYNISSGLVSGNDYNVSVSASGYFGAYYPTLVSVTVGQTTPNINIQMTLIPVQDYGTITGTVSEAPDTRSVSVTSVTCSPNPAHVHSFVTCTATVSGSNPTGTVTWSTSSIGGMFNQSVCIVSNGTCSTMYIDNFTGPVTIAAYYSGDSNNMLSTGSTALTITSAGPVYYSQNYTSVQAAINAAPSGATVIIAPGFYTESLILNKTLTIVGEKDPPVFGGGSSAIYLTLLSGASGSTVTGIEITNFQEGMLLENTSNCNIYGNIMASIGSSGIVLDGSNAAGNVISNNFFQDTPTPINLTDNAGGNTVYGNIITSQASVALNIGANGNVVYGNSMSGNQILLNTSNSNGNLFYHNNFQAAAQLTVVTTGGNSWDNGYPSGGNYWSGYAGVDLHSGPYQNLTGSDGIGDTPYVVGNGFADRYPLMTPWTASSGHCVKVLSVVAAKTVIARGFNGNITVCVADNGLYSESFSVTVYANTTSIDNQEVSSLSASCQMAFKFAWNTTGLGYGNYTITVYAQPVPGQTDISGNFFALGTLKVTVPGDINGDFRVSLSDLVLLANAYGSKPGTAKWNPNADIDGNGVVGLSDLVLLAVHYGQHNP